MSFGARVTLWDEDMKALKNDCQYSKRASLWHKSTVLLCLALIPVAGPFAAYGLTLGQIDDFQDGTTDGWTTGHSTPANIATGGPAGAGDRYMQVVSSGGFGTDSRLVVFNNSQWLGDYISAGITSVEMYLANFGTQTLSMRLAFFESSGVGYSATTAFSLPADSSWHHVVFPLDDADFTAVGFPSSSFGDLLANFTGQLRILDSASPAVNGDPIAATVGVDNILAVPEPSTFALVGTALLMAFCCRRAGRRSTENLLSN